MSLHATTWALNRVKSKPDYKAILVAMADHADDRGLCWPSMALIADKSGVCVRTVKRKIANLADMGVITIFPRSRGYQSRGHAYRLHVEVDFDLMEATRWRRIPGDVLAVPDTNKGDNLSPLSKVKGDRAVSPSKGTELCPRNRHKNLNNNNMNLSPPEIDGRPIRNDWRPTLETCQLLQDEGVPLHVIDELAGPFRLYWLDRQGRSHSWDTLFYRWALKKYLEPIGLTSPGSDVERFGGFAHVSN